MRVDVLGLVAVRGETTSVVGRELGGRRAWLVLVALATADGVVPAERLAQIVWGDDPPSTWAVALRGVVRGLRAAGKQAGGGRAELIVTARSGYQLADDVEVDLQRAVSALEQAGRLSAQERWRGAAALVEPITRLAGGQLLLGEDGEWLTHLRHQVDGLSLQATLLLMQAYGQLGEHRRVIEVGRQALDVRPLEEGLHRAVIAALAGAGDRAGMVQAYERCRSVLADELGVDPSAETVETYLSGLRDQTTSAVAPVPTVTTSLVGRRREVIELATAVARPGLVTVTGPGGVGKSRLAAQVATRVVGRPEFAGGRLWVSLSSVIDETLLASTVALALNLDVTDDPVAALGAHLAPLGRVLLMLDGCEPVLDGAASLANALLSDAPQVTLLATSRVPLGIDGERLLPLVPLPPPESQDGAGGHERLADNSQVRLLLDRVSEAGGTLSVDPGSAQHLVALCRRGGGLPLALELIAAQLAAMPPGDLVEHLAEAGPVGDDALRTIARSSYLQLDEDEAAVFRRLAVLDGQVGLSLIRQVVTGDPVAAVRVVRVLRELTARGLLVVDRGATHWRYHQDDDLHRFAHELLAESGEQWATYGRLGAAVNARLPEDARSAPGPFAAEITAMLGPIQSLFSAGLYGRADIDTCQQLAFRLHRYFATTNVAEGRFWLDRLLDARSDGPWVAYATYAAGYLAYWAGDTEPAMQHLQAAVALLDAERDSYRARALIFLAGLLDDADRGAEAIAHVRLSIAAAATHDVDLQVSAAMGMGSVLAERVDPTAAGYAGEAIDLCRRGGTAEQLSIALPTAAMICWQVGHLEAARSYTTEALPLNAGPPRISRVVLLSTAAGVALADADVAAAIEYGSIGSLEADQLGVDRLVPLVRAVLARALLAHADPTTAAEHSAAALRAALPMTIDYPLAIGLETAALVLDLVDGASLPDELADLLELAAKIRTRGDRPAPATLAPAVDQLRDRLRVTAGQGRSLDPLAAREFAERTISRLDKVAARG